MSKSVLIAVSDGAGGYGDFLFALKLSQQLKKQYIDAGLEPLSVYVVTQPSGKEKVQKLKGDIEHEAIVLTPDELKAKISTSEIEVGTIIEGPVFKMDLMERIHHAVESVPTPIPLLMIPEYAMPDQARLSDRQAPKFHRFECKEPILTGYDLPTGESGILVSDSLAKAASPELLISKVDEKIGSQLVSNTESIAKYQEKTELSMQYSHDIYTKDGESVIPAQHFLNIHREMCKDSVKNQDVIMVGNSIANKREALLAIKDKLIEDGFTRISFYNTDTKEEEILYESPETYEGKTYRVLYAKGMSHESMMACTALSGPLAGATGDQSFSEVVSGNKIMVYECLPHKKVLIKGYDEAIVKESGNDEKIKELITLLREAKSDDQYQRLGELLREPETYQKFAALNSALMSKYDLVTKIARDGLGMRMDLYPIARLLDEGKDEEALAFFQAQKGKINIFDDFGGTTLIEYAKIKNPSGKFVQYFNESSDPLLLQCIAAKQEEKAFELIRTRGLDINYEINGETLLSRAKGGGCTHLSKNIVLSHMVTLLKKPEHEEALEYFKIHDEITIFDEYEGKILLEYAKDNDNSVFLKRFDGKPLMIMKQYIASKKQEEAFDYFKKNTFSPEQEREIMETATQHKCSIFESKLFSRNFVTSLQKPSIKAVSELTEKQQLEAFEFLQNSNINPYTKKTGKSSFARALDQNCYIFAKKIMENTRSGEEKTQLFNILMSKNPKGERYLDQLKREYSEVIDPSFEAEVLSAPVTEISSIEESEDIATARAILEGGSTTKESNTLKTESGFYRIKPSTGDGALLVADHYSLNDEGTVTVKSVAIKSGPKSKVSSLRAEKESLEKLHLDEKFNVFTIGTKAYLTIPIVDGKVLTAEPPIVKTDAEPPKEGLLEGRKIMEKFKAEIPRADPSPSPTTVDTKEDESNFRLD